MRFIFFFLVLLLVPLSLYAAPGDFVPLVKIPGLATGSGTTLVEYVNAIFGLVIAIAAMLAVLRIVTGGFKYMTSEAIGEKGDARQTIQGAAFGLILLLGSWLILFTVNPNILDLSALQFNELGATEERQKEIDRDVEDQAAYEKFQRGIKIFPTREGAQAAADECLGRGGTLLAPVQRLCAQGPSGGKYRRNDDESTVCWYPQYGMSCGEPQSEG